MMDQNIQLMHPAGKKAVSVDFGKNNVLKKIILEYLKAKGESTHIEILRAINEDLETSITIFEGSVEWYMEWVKLDLEARIENNECSEARPFAN